jgi:hypothetical protein
MTEVFQEFPEMFVVLMIRAAFRLSGISWQTQHYAWHDEVLLRWLRRL